MALSEELLSYKNALLESARTFSNSLHHCIETEIDQIFRLMEREPAKIRVYDLELAVNLSETKLSGPMEELLRKTAAGFDSMIFCMDHVDQNNAQKLRPVLNLADNVNDDEKCAAILIRAQLETIIEAIDSGFDKVFTKATLVSLQSQLRRAHGVDKIRSPLDKFVFRLCNVFVSSMETILEVRIGDDEEDSEWEIEYEDEDDNDEPMLDPSQIKLEEPEEEQEKVMEGDPDATDPFIETEPAEPADEVAGIPEDTAAAAVPIEPSEIVTVADVAIQTDPITSIPGLELCFHGTISFIGSTGPEATADTIATPVEVTDAVETMEQLEDDQGTHAPDAIKDIADDPASAAVGASVSTASGAAADNLSAAAAELAEDDDYAECSLSRAHANSVQPYCDSADSVDEEPSEANTHVSDSNAVEQPTPVGKPRKRGRKSKKSITPATDAAAAKDKVEINIAQANAGTGNRYYDYADSADEEPSEANTHVDESYGVEQPKTFGRKRGRKPKKSNDVAAEVAAANGDSEVATSQTNAGADHPNYVYDYGDSADEEMSEANTHVSDSNAVEKPTPVRRPRKRGRKPKNSTAAAAETAVAHDAPVYQQYYDSADWADEEPSEANTHVDESYGVEQPQTVGRKRGRKSKKSIVTTADAAVANDDAEIDASNADAQQPYYEHADSADEEPSEANTHVDESYGVQPPKSVGRKRGRKSKKSIVAAVEEAVENGDNLIDAYQENADANQPFYDSADEEPSEAITHVDDSTGVEQPKSVGRKRGRKSKMSISTTADTANGDDPVEHSPQPKRKSVRKRRTQVELLAPEPGHVDRSVIRAVDATGAQPADEMVDGAAEDTVADDSLAASATPAAAAAANSASVPAAADAVEHAAGFDDSRIAAAAANWENEDNDEAGIEASEATIEALAESREHRLDLCLESATNPSINVFDEYPQLGKDTELIITDFCAESVKKPIHEAMGRLRYAFAGCKKFEKFVEADKIRGYPNNQLKADLRSLQILARYFPIERKKRRIQEDSKGQKKYCHLLTEIYNHFQGASTAEQALQVLIEKGITHPSIVSFGKDRMKLYVNMHGRLVKVNGGIPEAMLALLAVFSVFNYKFEAISANVANVLGYFWYAIGKTMRVCPPEVLEAIRIKNGKEPEENEEEESEKEEEDTEDEEVDVVSLDEDSETELGSVGYDTECDEEPSASSEIEDGAFKQEQDDNSDVGAELGSSVRDDLPELSYYSPVRPPRGQQRTHLRPGVFASPASPKVNAVVKRKSAATDPTGSVSPKVSMKRKRSIVNYAESVLGSPSRSYNAREESSTPAKRAYRKRSALNTVAEVSEDEENGSKRIRTVAAPIPSRPEITAQSRSHRYEQCMAAAGERNGNIFEQFPQLLLSTDMIIGDFCAMDLRRPPPIVRQQIRRAFEKCKTFEQHAKLHRNDNFANSPYQVDLQALLVLVLYFNWDDDEERKTKTKKRPPKDKQRFNKLYCHIDKPNPNDTLDEMMERNITQPSIVTYGNDRSILYVSIQDNLVKVNGGVQEAMLALMAIYHTFNYNFDPKVKDVLTYFWYSIGKTVNKCPKEVTKILERR